MEITLDISNDQVDIIKRAFGLERFKTKEDLAKAVLPLAFEAWFNWLSGEKRYNSLTEQYTDWIEKIYDDLLPTEAPSAERLFNFFNVPYGQAQYIARVLSNCDTARWRTEALNELKAKLLEQRDKVYSWTDQTGTVDLKLFKPEMIQLRTIFEDLGHESPRDIKIPGRSGWGNLTVVTIDARTFKKVCERLAI